MSSNLQNSIWPNEGGTLGQIKVQIPTGTADDPWPTGDALVHNFVYQNGKLVGFVDTKALILNESATTTFPYDYVDISLPSIEEGTLTIKRGDRCKYLNVKLYNHEWLPVGFTELDFLESSGTQFIDTGIATDGTYTISARMQLFSSGKDVWGRRSNNGGEEGSALPYGNSVLSTYNETALVLNYVWRGYNRNSPFDIKQSHDYVVAEGQMTFKVDGVSQTISSLNLWPVKANNTDSISHFLFWTNVSNGVSRSGKALASVYSFSMQDGEGNVVLDLVPVLNTEGVPGMFDKINKQFYENKGSGIFGYRIKTSGKESTPLSLRDPYYVAPSGVYAKLIAENELEIVADTEEVQGDDWVHFANTSEAYSHFNIVLPNVE